MRMVDALPAPWIVSWLFLLACGVAAPLLGKRLPRRGDWLIGLGALTLLVATGGLGAEIADPAQGAFQLTRGWLATQGEANALLIGSIFDSLGIGMSLWTLVMVCIAVAALGFGAQEPRSERLSGGLGIAAAGTVLSWHASTPWFALAGLGLTVLGTWTVAGSRWELGREADLMARIVSERAWGLLLCGLGASIIACATPAQSDVTSVGSWFLAVGLMIFLSPFPLQGSLAMASDVTLSFRFLTQHLLPASAAFALLIRWAEPFRLAGVLEPLGWIALASAASSLLFSLFAAQWRAALLGWFSAASAVAVAFVALEGSRSGVAIFIGSASAAFVLALVGGILDSGAESEVKGGGTATFIQEIALVAAFFGSGGIASLGAGPWVEWFGRALSDPGLAALLMLLTASLAMSLWRVGWQLKSHPPVRATSRAQLAVATFAVLPLLGVLWSGTVTGGWVSGDGDRILSSWLNSAATNFKAAPPEGPDATAIALYMVAWILGLGVAYATTGRRGDLWSVWTARWNRVTAFILGGFGFDRLGSVVMQVFNRSGGWFSLHSERAWSHWIPNALSAAVEGGSLQIHRAEQWLIQRVSLGMRRSVVFSSEAVRMNQTGDVRWYVFFSIGVGILLLLVLMR